MAWLDRTFLASVGYRKATRLVRKFHVLAVQPADDEHEKETKRQRNFAIVDNAFRSVVGGGGSDVVVAS